MKLEKNTKHRQKEEKRRFEDACGLAHALELLGERWAMLVLRQLAYGPRRFSELKADLQGISANVLTQRLEGLLRQVMPLASRLDRLDGVPIRVPWDGVKRRGICS